MSVVISYIKACTFSMTGLVILFYVLTNAASVGSNFWLAHWSNEESASSEKGTDMSVFCTSCTAYIGPYTCLYLKQVLTFIGIALIQPLEYSFLTLFMFTMSMSRILTEFKIYTLCIQWYVPGYLRSTGFLTGYICPAGCICSRIGWDICL